MHPLRQFEGEEQLRVCDQALFFLVLGVFVPPNTMKLKFLAGLERIFAARFLSALPWERTHPACSASDTRGTLEAGSVRSQGRPPRSLRLCGEVFGCG